MIPLQPLMSDFGKGRKSMSLHIVLPCFYFPSSCSPFYTSPFLSNFLCFTSVVNGCFFSNFSFGGSIAPLKENNSFLPPLAFEKHLLFEQVYFSWKKKNTLHLGLGFASKRDFLELTGNNSLFRLSSLYRKGRLGSSHDLLFLLFFSYIFSITFPWL